MLGGQLVRFPWLPPSERLESSDPRRNNLSAIYMEKWGVEKWHEQVVCLTPSSPCHRQMCLAAETTPTPTSPSSPLLRGPSFDALHSCCLKLAKETLFRLYGKTGGCIYGEALCCWCDETLLSHSFHRHIWTKLILIWSSPYCMHHLKKWYGPVCYYNIFLDFFFIHNMIYILLFSFITDTSEQLYLNYHTSSF